MTPDEYEQMRLREGFDTPRKVTFAALSRSEPHIHDKASFVYVLEGEFILNVQDKSSLYQPGEICLLGANVEHAEEAGAKGATILVSRR